MTEEQRDVFVMSAKSAQLTAVVFDMDGLMVNSESLAREVWNTVLADFGCQMDDETHRQMVGRRTGESARIVQERFALPLSPEELAARKTRLWESVWRNRDVPLMPGLERLQDELARRQIPWGVATSSPRQYAEHVVAGLPLADRCRAIAAGDEVERGKPAPDIYLLAAERMQIPPERCLALEDSVPGGRAAQAAGMTLAAIPNGTTASADFPFADYVFSSLHEVAGHLDRLLPAG